MDVTDVNDGRDVRIRVDTVDERRRRLELGSVGRRRAIGGIAVDGEGERTVVRLGTPRRGCAGYEPEQSECRGSSCSQAQTSRTSWHPRTSDISAAPPRRDFGRTVRRARGMAAVAKANTEWTSAKLCDARLPAW